MGAERPLNDGDRFNSECINEIMRQANVDPSLRPQPEIGLPPAMEEADRHSRRYADLRRIMLAAYRFAAEGKGEERHGRGKLPWSDQRHFQIGREVGTGFAIGQAVKKALESEGLDDAAAIRELQGAMTYLASAIYLIEKGVRNG